MLSNIFGMSQTGKCLEIGRREYLRGIFIFPCPDGIEDYLMFICLILLFEPLLCLSEWLILNISATRSVYLSHTLLVSLLPFWWNSDVRSKAFQAVDQFLQIVKQHHDKVYILLDFCFVDIMFSNYSLVFKSFLSMKLWWEISPLKSWTVQQA